MYKKILVPVALDHGHDPEDAIAIAKTFSGDGTEIILLHVLEEIPSYVSSELPDDIFDNAQKGLKSELNTVASNAGANVRGVVVMGHAGSTINNYAEENGIDCIVIASHRPEWSDYLLGSTAARVVRHASCSVHVIR
ncbi:MAG: universal stress protein [Pseudomonadota bacterium]